MGAAEILPIVERNGSAGVAEAIAQLESSSAFPIKVLWIEAADQARPSARGLMESVIESGEQDRAEPAIELIRAHGGPDAIRCLAVNPPDICIADERSCDAETLELLGDVSANPSGIPFILLRAATGQGGKPLRQCSGATAILDLESVDADELKCAIQRAVSDRRRAEALRAASIALDRMSDSAAYIDSAGRIVLANRAACELYGYTRAEFLKLDIASLDSAVSIEDFRQFWKRLLHQGDELIFPTHVDRHGRRFPVESHCSMFVLEGERYVCAVTRDISVREETRKETVESEDRLRHQNHALASLARRKTLYQGEFDAVAREITEEVAITLKVDDVIIALFNEDRSELRIADRFQTDRSLHGVLPALSGWDATPTFFQTLELSRALTAFDFATDENYAEIREHYDATSKAGACICAPIRVDARLGGLIIAFHRESPRAWRTYDISFVASMADCISIALEVRKHRSTADQLALRAHEQEFILNHVPAMVVIKDLNNRVVRVNQIAADTIGLPISEMEGRPVEDFLPDYVGRMKALDDQVFKTEKPAYGGVEKVRMPNGDTKYFKASKVPYRNSRGEIDGTIAFVFDVSDQVRAEQALRRREDKFRCLTNLSPVGIFESDANGDCIFVNERWSWATGYSNEEAQGRGWAAPVHPDFREEVIKNWYENVARGEDFEMDFRTLGKHGQAAWARTIARVIRNGDGEMTGILGTVLNMTEHIATADALVRTKQLSDFTLACLEATIWRLDRKGVVRSVENLSSDASPVTRGDLVGRSFLTLHPEIAERLRPVLCGKQPRVEISAETQEGSARVWSHYFSLEAQSGEICGISFEHPAHRSDSMPVERDVQNATPSPGETQIEFEGIIGRSSAMQEIFAQIREVVPYDSTVLIDGETGTGKEIVARSIHAAGPRGAAPFIAINCGAMTQSLLHSQLFGHRRGAFTGAMADQEGFFEAARGGTLFLDEIGDIALDVQTSLLRVLQEREITRLGETRTRKVDVRIIAATQHDLGQLVSEGRFREDLLYRIRVARMTLPPLRDRLEDVPLLARFFLDRLRQTMPGAAHTIDRQAMRLLQAHAWPGNVRELQSAIEFATIRCHRTKIAPSDLPPEIARAAAEAGLSNRSIPTSREMILAALRKSKGNRRAAADHLGISRATLYRRLRQLDMGA